MKTPCKDCAERHKGCWGDCEKYKAFDAENVRRREKAQQEQIANQYITDQIKDNVEKREKKKYIRGGGY